MTLYRKKYFCAYLVMINLQIPCDYSDLKFQSPDSPNKFPSQILGRHISSDCSLNVMPRASCCNRANIERLWLRVTVKQTAPKTLQAEGQGSAHMVNDPYMIPQR